MVFSRHVALRAARDPMKMGLLDWAGNLFGEFSEQGRCRYGNLKLGLTPLALTPLALSSNAANRFYNNNLWRF